MLKLVIASLLVIGALGAPEGKRNGIDTHITGGSDAKQGEHKHHLGLRLVGSNSPFCSAVIYNSDTAITAAQCVEGREPRSLEVVAGDLNKYDTSGFEQILQVRRIVMHEDYSSTHMHNDIAIMRLDGHFQTNQHVKQGHYPYPGQPSRGLCNVTGWGELEADGEAAEILQMAQVPVISDEECQEIYGSDLVKTANVCAGAAGKDACAGDSGAPLMCDNVYGVPYVAGIVSWGYQCGDADYPGVYTEISEYIIWIMHHLNS